MEYLGLLLVLISPLVALIALWAVFRPIPQLRLTTKFRAAMTVLGSLAAMMVGMVLIAAFAEVPADPGKAAVTPAARAPERKAAPARKPDVAALAMTADDLIGAMNKLWREADQSGAFAVAGDDLIKAGPNAGGKITRACVNDSNCMLIETTPSGRVVSATSITGTDGSATGAAQSILSSMGILIAVGEGNPEAGREFNRQLQRLVDGADNDPVQVGKVCLTVSGGGEIGVWTSVSAPPCERS